MAESIVILKEKDRLRGKSGGDSVPINGIGKVNVEIRDHWLSLVRQVRRRREVGLLDILQLADQSLLRRTSRAGIPLDRALVDHNGEGEAGMSFGFRHHEFCGLIDAGVRTIPIDDHAIDSAADHIRNLPVDLRRVGGVVAHVHMVRPSEPKQQVSVDLRAGAGIEQGMDIHLANIPGTFIAIGLTAKTVGRTGIVCRLRGQRGGGYNVVSGRAYTCRGQEQNYNTQIFKNHLSSGAEGTRHLQLVWERGPRL